MIICRASYNDDDDDDDVVVVVVGNDDGADRERETKRERDLHLLCSFVHDNAPRVPWSH